MHNNIYCRDNEDDHGKRRLRRNGNKVIGGVAAGFARFCNIDPVLSRLLFVVLAIVGPGIPIYLIAWILMPRDHDVLIVDEEPVSIGKRSPGVFGLLFKGLLLLLGVALLTDGFETNFGMAMFFVGLAIGGYIFWNNFRGESGDEVGTHTASGSLRLYRSVTDRKIAGVFGGLAERFGIDPTLLRIIGVLLLFAGFPVTVLCYFISTLIVPKEELTVRMV